MPSCRRLLIAGLAAALAHEVLALGSALVLGPARTTWWLALSGLLVAGVTRLAVFLIERPPPGGADGGAAVAPPEPPPSWWPAFERDFERHVAGRRDREPV